MICNTGGAIGSNLCFEENCINNGIEVRAFSFKGHRTDSKHKRILPNEFLEIPDKLLIEIAKRLKRTVPFDKPWIVNLLRRNFFQIADANITFAIGNIKVDCTIEGGTGWAIEMSKMVKIPIYVFDQNKNGWFKWNYDIKEFKITELIIDKVYNVFAGIGTRDLKENGRLAIASLIQQLKNYE